MTQPITDWVIDTSVALKLLIDEDLSEKAERFFADSSQDVSRVLWVPSLFYVEIANVLWKCVRMKRMKESLALEFMTRILSYGFRCVAIEELAARALHIALKSGITAYDAAYLALAERCGATVLTADERLLRAMKTTKHRVVWLGELD